MRKTSFTKQLSQSFLQEQKSYSKQKGFALSIDALLATVLTITVLTFIGFGMQSSEESITPSEIRIRQTVDDTFTALDNSGYLINKLVDDIGTNPAQEILEKVQTLVSKNTELYLEITEYKPTLSDACTATKNFDQCFEELINPLTAGTNPSTLQNKEIMHGKKLLITKSLGRDESDDTCTPVQEQTFKEKETKPKAKLDPPEDETNIRTQAIVTDTDEELIQTLSCDETATVTLKLKDNSREPIAVVLAMDKSGSMETYDMLRQTGSGTFNDGTCGGNDPQWVAGKFGNALQFDGETDFVFVPHNDTLDDTSGGITISAWIKADSFSEGYQGIALKQTQGTYEMWIHDNQPVFGLNINGTLHRIIATNVNLLPNTWYHLAYTYNNGFMRIYIDGTQEEFYYKTGTITEKSSNRNIYIGYAGYSTQYFDGIIDDVRIYNKALRWDEIDKVRTNENLVADDPVAGNLIAHWKMDESSGNIVPDTSGNNNNGSWNTNDTCANDSYVSNCPSPRTDGAQYTGWVEKDSFIINDTYTEALKSIFPTVYSETYMYYIGTSDKKTDICGTIPKLKIVAPNDTYYRYGQVEGESSNAYPDYFAYLYRADIDSPSNILNQPWKLYSWSNNSYDTFSNGNVKIYKWIRGYVNAASSYVNITDLPDNMLTARTQNTIEGQPCDPDLTTAIKIGEIGPIPQPGNNLRYYRITGYMYYDNYNVSANNCRPWITLKRKDGEGTTPTPNICQSSTNYCSDTIYYPTVNENGIDEDEIYELWAWTDDEINITEIKFAVYLERTDKTVELTSDDDSLLACSGEVCDKEIQKGNCDSTINWKNDLDIFNIQAEDDLSGFEVNWNYSNYNGVCGSPKFKITGPQGEGSTETSSNNQTELFTDPALGEWKFEGWSDGTTDYTVEWKIQRLDAAKQAAKTFINNVNWSTGDQLGLVSFSNLADITSPLQTDNEVNVKTALNTLTPSGETGLAGVINQSAQVIIDASLDPKITKFIILLTDGRANICSDGSSCSEADAATDAITAANKARQDVGATIFVIGFADASIANYQDTLEEIAKDVGTTYCNDGINCGRYYYAQDEQDLQDIYYAVIGEISSKIGGVDIKIPIDEGINPIQLAGAQLDTVGKTGIWDDTTKTWALGTSQVADAIWSNTTRNITITDKGIYNPDPNLWTAIQFQIEVPCNGSYCDLNHIIIPSTGIEIIERSKPVGTPPKKWTKKTNEDKYCNLQTTQQDQCPIDTYFKVPFEYKDLAINFKGGTVELGKVILDLNIGNKGFKSITATDLNPIKIKFSNTQGLIADVQCGAGGCELKASNVNTKVRLFSYLDSDLVIAANNEIKLITNLTLCKVLPNTINCSYGDKADTETTIENIEIPNNPGTITAEIYGINECSKGNTATIECGETELKFYTIDYYAWVK